MKNSGKIQVPAWVDLVKTGVDRELPPTEEDWFFKRAAALARHVYLKPGCGVGSLAKLHGGKKNNGHRPGKHCNASRNVIRKAMQSLEKAGILKAVDSGRSISVDGQRDLDRVALLCSKKY